MGFLSRFDVRLKNWLFAALFSLAALAPYAQAQAGYAHYIIDLNTGKVLASRNANVRNYPASLTKMMTLYMAFDAIHHGKMSWHTRIPITRRAARVEPLKLGLPAGRKLTVREAVLSMIVLSANDAAQSMCDYLAKLHHQNCGAMLTRGAHRLGMSRSTFRNGSGLPNSHQMTTARDMATLGAALMRRFPKEYRLFSVRSFKFRGRTIRGHNHLMYRYRGMDGIKTGFTNASGFNIVTAVNRNGKHVIGVLMGGRTSRSRDSRMAKLLDAAMPRASSTRKRHHKPVSQLVAKLDKVPVPASRPYKIPAPVNTETPDRELTTGSIPNSGWQIQIAAVEGRDAAQSMLEKAQASARSRLGGAKPFTERVAADSSIYRARFVGFDSRHEANAACRALEARSFDCLVLSSDG